MSERLTLSIDIANDAFTNSPTGEIARILRNYARALERGTIDPGYTPLMDINGNRVGEAQINSIGDDDDARLREAHGGTWGEHPDHLVAVWRHEAGEDYTRLGYWEWVAARVKINSIGDDDDCSA